MSEQQRELREFREKNMEKVGATPARGKKPKQERPFEIHQRFCGKVPPLFASTGVANILWGKNWSRIGKFATLDAARKSFRSETRKGWKDNFELRIVNTLDGTVCAHQPARTLG